jgi:hypothetical protein
MYRNISKVVIQQETPYNNIGRSKTIMFDFIHKTTASDSWRDFTNDGSVIVPKNLYYKDDNGKLQPLYGTNVNIGGFDSSPLFMKGDKVTIDSGYKYLQGNNEQFQGTENIKGNTHLYEGYISEVSSKQPITFKCEDNFWKLKQIACPTKTYPATTTLEFILQDLLKDTQFTVNVLTNTTFGQVMVGNETVAEFLLRIRKAYHFESYFRGNELRCGSAVYVPSEAKEYTFTFQKDIISDDLKYKRKDDLVLSCITSNTNEVETGETTKDGKNKTTKERIEVLTTFKNGSEEPKYIVKEKGKDFPPNVGGERMTIPIPGATTIQQLKDAGLNILKKYYYTGFKGKFTTFGIPFVKMGDNVTLIDPILPERNGKYKVKSVEYENGIDGNRQEIELDYKILI